MTLNTPDDFPEGEPQFESNRSLSKNMMTLVVIGGGALLLSVLIFIAF